MTSAFEELLAEGAAVPVDGWDFSWFDGRATEERPAWGYSRLVSQRMAHARSALDVQTGGGEVLAGIEVVPPRLAATESWPPNVPIARRALAPLGASVHQVADDAPLPFDDGSFDLVVSRHPTVTVWSEIARVLEPGGTYLSQQVGPLTAPELTRAMLGQDVTLTPRSPGVAVTAAREAGLDVVDLRTQELRLAFVDVAAVVHYLRKVVWIVPGFSVERFRPQLLTLHQQIEESGELVAHTGRFLVEARKPDRSR
ncbi:methyltransferase domain-containing protein [Actinotalea sp. K2]|nr:methyltransferase domain-containing protein [Actinotalea sp. K2]